MYDHTKEDIWEATDVSNREMMKKLKGIDTRCYNTTFMPSERIELMATKLKRVELAILIYILEEKIAKLSYTKYNSDDNPYIQ